MLTDNTRTQAREMTSDLSIYHGPAATMAVVLLEHMDCVAELEATEKGMGAGLRLSDEKRRQAEARVTEFQKRIISLNARVAELEKVHSAACRHLEEQGPCDDTGDHDDEYHCGGECTYCDLNQFTSDVRENTDQSGEGES